MRHRHIFTAAKIADAVYRITLSVALTGALIAAMLRQKKREKK